jgi:hypothetical protein
MSRRVHPVNSTIDFARPVRARRNGGTLKHVLLCMWCVAGLVLLGALGVPTTACSKDAECFDVEPSATNTSCSSDCDCFAAVSHVCTDCTGVCVYPDIAVNATGWAQFQANMSRLTDCSQVNNGPLPCPYLGPLLFNGVVRGAVRCVANVCRYSPWYGTGPEVETIDGGLPFDCGSGEEQ